MSDFKSMMDLTGFSGIRANAEQGDYYGEDGLLRCGTCDEPKEQLSPMGERSVVTPRQCACRRIESERREREEKAREHAAKADKMRRECFPYPALFDMTFSNDDGKNKALFGKCQKYVEHFDRFKAAGVGLLLAGDVGGGKTYAAASIANALIDNGRSVVFTSLATLGGKMAENYGNDRLEILRDITRHDLVILDDLGVERTTPTMNENVYQVVNALEMAKTPVIYTTNIDPKAMHAETDPDRKRIYSRIFASCRLVVVGGVDRRRESTREKAELFGLLD